MIEELTAEILAAEKNAYGKVIRMMAHEVNNTVGPVNSIIQSALQSKDLWKESDSLLKNALEVAHDRNQNLNVFMRNFADLVKLPEPNKKKLDLHRLIRSTATLMASTTVENMIDLQVDLADEPFYILADEHQLEQALINILKNAGEAIVGQGQIRISSDPGKHQIVICDTGKGISEEVAEQIFTPFFSSKKDGQGIGLTLVREILVNHGFEFSLKTMGENHTEFKIKF